MTDSCEGSGPEKRARWEFFNLQPLMLQELCACRKRVRAHVRTASPKRADSSKQLRTDQKRLALQQVPTVSTQKLHLDTEQQHGDHKGPKADKIKPSSPEEVLASITEGKKER